MSDALCAPQGAGTRNLASMAGNPVAILSTRLAKLSLEDIARALGKDDTTACKIRNGDRNATVIELAKLIDVAGLKLVDKARVCVKIEEYNFMRRLTARALTNERIAQELTFDDPE